jgi:alkylated DNA repair protein (DNA oxidative demethylase)
MTVSTRQLSFDYHQETADADADQRADWPQGLVYRPNFVTGEEEGQLLSFIETLDLRPVTMRGQESRRTVRHFGYLYGYESSDVVPGDPIPPELTWLRDRCAAYAELHPDELAQALVSRYPTGAGIGWHRDAPKFGPKVVGVSLLSGCRMRFQRRTGGRREVFAIELEPRSAYVLGGSARSAWQHSIPAAKALRYSITFRTLKRSGAPALSGSAAPR